MASRRPVLSVMGAAAPWAFRAGAVRAQDYTLRMHQFLSAKANAPALCCMGCG